MNILRKIARFLIIVMVPVILMMTSIRIVCNNWYPEVAYRMPGFPEDTFGFSMDERLHWAKESITYLNNSAGIEYLANLKFADGTPIYNERELSHMLDVKNLIQAMVVAWYILIGVLILFLLWAKFDQWLPDFWTAISRGGMATGGLIGFIIIAVVVAFDWLFTSFHHIFFTGDTWLFLYSDTLIRLFPIPFWSMAFIFVGVFSLIGAAVCFFGGRKLALR